MKTRSMPVFRGRYALIVHKDDRDRRALESQLARLGMTVDCRTSVTGVDWPAVQVCFFDADTHRRHAFPWVAGKPSIPLIALIGLETPERIHWSFLQGISAFLVKPIRSNGTYLALMQAEHVHQQNGATDLELNDLKDRVKSRRIVFKALVQTMKRCNLSEDQAFDRIREISMNHAISIEELCVALVCGESLDDWKTNDSGTG
ncbi:ANTAR domain-containing response regulator [Caballeronia sp. LjRoot31]|uniref:ANTAR domain-containing response regulator n=1 Tax=Caballeronia sp. LjRoot31 TaxID=3342324 RepID=UPI003ECE09F5